MRRSVCLSVWTCLTCLLFAMPTEARFIDPAGLDRVEVRGGIAYRVVEQNGFFYNPDVRRVSLGTVTGTRGRHRDNRVIQIAPQFGGGTVSVVAAQREARRFYREFADISGQSIAVQNRIIRNSTQRAVKGNLIATSHPAVQIASGAGTGAADGIIVEADFLTLSLHGGLNREANRIKRQAAQNGDVLSQTGFVFGGAGARGVQLSLILASGGTAAPTLGVSGSGSAYIGATVQTTRVAVTGVSIFGAASEAEQSFNAFSSGDLSGGFEKLGDAALFFGVGAQGAPGSVQALNQIYGTARNGVVRFGNSLVLDTTLPPTSLNAPAVQSNLFASSLGRPVTLLPPTYGLTPISPSLANTGASGLSTRLTASEQIKIAFNKVLFGSRGSGQAVQVTGEAALNFFNNGILPPGAPSVQSPFFVRSPNLERAAIIGTGAAFGFQAFQNSNSTSGSVVLDPKQVFLPQDTGKKKQR